jgi:hypothetical protein
LLDQREKFSFLAVQPGDDLRANSSVSQPHQFICDMAKLRQLGTMGRAVK